VVAKLGDQVERLAAEKAAAVEELREARVENGELRCRVEELQEECKERKEQGDMWQREIDRIQRAHELKCDEVTRQSRDRAERSSG